LFVVEKMNGTLIAFSHALLRVAEGSAGNIPGRTRRPNA